MKVINQYLCNYGLNLWRLKDDENMRDAMLNNHLRDGQIKNVIFSKHNNLAYSNWLEQLSTLSMSVVLNKPLIPKMVPNIKSFNAYVQELKLNNKY